MRYHSFRLLFTVLLINQLLVFNYAQSAPDARGQQAALVQGKPIERELNGGEVHAYSIPLKAGQFFNVTVDQRGIDVVVLLFAPDGTQLAEVDSPNGTQGPEPLFWLAEASGGYSLKVRSLEKDAAGRYEVRIEALRNATTQDKNRIAADKIFAEGGQLMEQRTAASARKAIEKYDEAVSLLRVVGDRYKEAVTLNRIGTIYSSLGDLEKALEYFNLALPVWRAIGDRGYEANALNNIGSVYEELGELQKALDYFRQGLALAKASGDTQSEAQAIQNIGYSYGQLGDKSKMLEFFLKALALRRSSGDRRGEALTLSGIGGTILIKKSIRKHLNILINHLPSFAK